MSDTDMRKAETAHLLPTLIPDSGDDNADFDAYDVVWAALSRAQLQMLMNRGLSVQDVLDHKVPGLDPDEIIAQVRVDNA